MVRDRVPLDVSVEYSNYQAPSIGGERGLVSFAYRSLTRNGDVLSGWAIVSIPVVSTPGRIESGFGAAAAGAAVGVIVPIRVARRS